MAGENEHGQMITAAAKDILAPHGFRQKGQSRLWFADHEWWLIVVEFQPSGWSRGTYLNVAAKWLWAAFPHWSFDFSFAPGSRIADFQEFKNEEQFKVVTRELANAALLEGRRLRDAFSTIRAVSDVLVSRASNTGSAWDFYHAAAATFLTDRITNSQKLFFQLSHPSPGDPPSATWLRDLRKTAARFATLTSDRPRMRTAILDQIVASRADLRLPNIEVKLPDV